jgi:hypothetical protein
VRSPTRELPPARNRLWLYCVQHRAGARGVAISPYTAEVDAAEHRFFAEGGLETVAGAHLGIGDGFGLAEPEPKAILDLALGACEPSADGIVIACLNFRSHPIIDTLEARIGNRSSLRRRRCCGTRFVWPGATPIHGWSGLLRGLARPPWKIARRNPIHDQNVLTAKNISVFFWMLGPFRRDRQTARGIGRGRNL